LAIKPRDNEAFYREVDEELRRDQLKSYWERYGKLAIAAFVLLLAAIGGAIWWNNQKELKAGERGETLIASFDEVGRGKKADAVKKLDQLAASDSPGYRVAALLTKADLAIEANDLNAAAALYRQIADDKGLAKEYRDLALVRLTHAEFDRLAPQAVIDRMKPLAVAGGPWHGSAGEMVATAHLKLNQPGQAARIFAAIAQDRKVPDSLRTRALQMAGSLGVDAIQEPTTAQQEGSQ
jgi:hypothetical protein